MSNFEKITSFLEFLGDAILIINDTSEIIFANSACANLFGYKQDQMYQLQLDSLIGKPPKKTSHQELARKYIHSDSPAIEMMARSAISCINAKGNEFDARISISNVRIDEEIFGVATIQDYTSVQKIISTLESDSNVDELTNLFNRRYLQEVLKPNSRVLQSWQSIGVLYLDLNKFKPVNDTYGHNIGDTVLTVVSNRLKGSVRFDDLLFRLGGDEFLILLNLTKAPDKSEALTTISGKIHAKIAESILIQNHCINIGVSIGGGVYPDNEKDLAKLIHLADKSMYSSKKDSSTVTFVNQLPAMKD